MHQTKTLHQNKYGTYRMPLGVFMFTFFMLSMIETHAGNLRLLLLERFIHGGGWIEVAVISIYGAFVAYKMQDPMNVPRWRRITWTLFSVVFFSQLVIGLLGASRFLMTGKLHLPIPMMILGGPIYREHLSFMTFLFLSTIVLTGPAWCSQLCYFGAIDNFAAKGKTSRKPLRHKKAVKSTVVLIVIVVALILRWINVPALAATLIAVAFGLIGLTLMYVFSRKMGKMIHCTLYCPIGTLVNVLKPVNPFRLYIDSNCTLCMKCTTFCKYDALNIKDVRNKKPDFNCTLCGDCLAACRDRAIKYRFLKLKPETARYLYLFLTISFHAIFLAVARI